MTRERILIGSIVVLAINNLITLSAARVFERELKDLKDRYKRLHASTGYLVDLLERHGVELDEFDLIALKTNLENDDAAR